MLPTGKQPMRSSEIRNNVAATVRPDEARPRPTADGEGEPPGAGELWTAGTATLAAESPAGVRAVCRELLDQIPDEGLAELFAALEAIRDFYAPPPSNLVGEPSVIRTRARLRTTYRRPDFHIDEE